MENLPEDRTVVLHRHRVSNVTTNIFNWTFYFSNIYSAKVALDTCALYNQRIIFFFVNYTH